MSGRRLLGAAFIGLILATGLQAQDLSNETRWLAPDLDTTLALASQPRRTMATPDEASWFLVTLGEVAFRSPDILGPVARRGGLSCNVCHPNGHVAANFFAEELSDKPGNVDLTTAVFRHLADDGVFNPVNIPSLRGVAATAPYGREGQVGTVRRFSRTVIVAEFGGDEPSGRLLDALVAYQQLLDFAPNPALLDDGRLAATAPEAARRGEVVFVQSNCARCHLPDDHFMDHRRYRVGSGGAYVTPTLLGLAATSPYFHDGRYSTLADVVAHFNSAGNLGLGRQERRDLVAYLDAVGAVENDRQPVTLDGVLADMNRFDRLLDTTLAAGDLAPTRLVVGELHRMMAGLDERFPEAGQAALRGVILDWAIALRATERRAEAGDTVGAATALAAYRRLFDTTAEKLRDASGQSLFNPQRLNAFLASQAK